MSHFDVGQFSYMLLPGRCPPEAPYEKIYEQVYQHWKNTWKEVFTENGAPQALVADDFRRQDVIAVIFYKDQIAAFHLYTFFDIRQQVVRDSRYFSIFTEPILKQFRDRKAFVLMTMEFLTVLPEFRKGEINISLGKVISNLGIHVQMDWNGHSSVAPARKIVKVSDMAYELGAICLEPDVTRGNLLCDLIAFFPQNVRPYADINIQRLVKHLWENRIDYTVKYHKLITPARFGKAA